MNKITYALLITLTLFCLTQTRADTTLKQELSACKNKLVCEGYENGNWDLFIMNADGSKLKNLTNTPKVNELFPHVSPNGKMVLFLVDSGEGRQKVRSAWVMSIDGKVRKKIADYARQPFWSPDSKTIVYLPQEYKKFDPRSLANKGMVFYDIATGKKKNHPNAENIFHLFNPSFSPDGKWIISTVHAGMGLKHGNLLIEANGNRIIDLHMKGCRPDFSPDGKYIAWGRTDHLLLVVPFIDGENPHIGKPIFSIKDKKNKVYHIDWAPNGKWVAISRGPSSKGDRTKPGTVIHAAETVGVYAAKWNLFVIRIPKEHGKTLDFQKPNDGSWVKITTKGSSYKEPDWVPLKAK